MAYRTLCTAVPAVTPEDCRWAAPALQLEMVPADFFRDQLSGDNFLRGALTQLFECARARTHAPHTAHSIVHGATQRVDVQVRNPVRSRRCRQGRSFSV